MEAKQVKDLMEAYASVYLQQPEQEVISEDLQKTVEKGLDAAAKNPVIKAIGKVIAPVGKGRGTVTKAEQEGKIKGNVKEETDLFDIILEYLVAEGYADTSQSALVIMANMSEEWKQSIVEQDLTARQKYLIKKVGDMNAAKSGSAHTAIPGKQSAGGALDNANRSAMQMRGV